MRMTRQQTREWCANKKGGKLKRVTGSKQEPTVTDVGGEKTWGEAGERLSARDNIRNRSVNTVPLPPRPVFPTVKPNYTTSPSSLLFFPLHLHPLPHELWISKKLSILARCHTPAQQAASSMPNFVLPKRAMLRQRAPAPRSNTETFSQLQNWFFWTTGANHLASDVSEKRYKCPRRHLKPSKTKKIFSYIHNFPWKWRQRDEQAFFAREKLMLFWD